MSTEYVRMTEEERISSMRADAARRAEERKLAEEQRQQELADQKEHVKDLEAQLAMKNELIEKQAESDRQAEERKLAEEQRQQELAAAQKEHVKALEAQLAMKNELIKKQAENDRRAEERKLAEEQRQQELTAQKEQLKVLEAQLAMMNELLAKSRREDNTAVAETTIQLGCPQAVGSKSTPTAAKTTRDHDGKKKEEAWKVLFEGVDNEQMARLTAQAAGRRVLWSVPHGTVLRAYKNEWKVDMKHGAAESWEHWYVEDWKKCVVFKAIHSPGLFLRAHPDGKVDLVPTFPDAWEKWVPFRNNDGSFSFRNHHGKWLSARQNGSVSCVDKLDTWEKFRLENW